MRSWNILTVLISSYIVIQIESTVIAETTKIEVVPLQIEEFEEYQNPVVSIHSDIYEPENITYITTKHHVYKFNLFTGLTEILINQKYESLGDIIQINTTTFIVSDLYNHCLHIVANGNPVTYAGTCKHDKTPMYDYDGFDQPYGTIEGNRLEIDLVSPSGLSLAKNNLYISQSGDGLIITRINLETDQAYLVLKDILALPLWTRYYTTFDSATNFLYSLTDKGVLKYDVVSGNHSLARIGNFEWNYQSVYHMHVVSGRILVDDGSHLYSVDGTGNDTITHPIKDIHGTVLFRSDKIISVNSQILTVSTVAFMEHSRDDNFKSESTTLTWIPVYIFVGLTILVVVAIVVIRCTYTTPKKQGFKTLQTLKRIRKPREDNNELLDSDEEFDNSP